METSTVKELIGSNADLRSELEDYVTSYIDWVVENVPSHLRNAFGVGIVSDNRFGTYYGFWNEANDCYTSTGKSCYIGNDFNCRVQGSTPPEMRAFAKAIPDFIESGLAALEAENKELSELLSKKVHFD